MKIGLTQLRTNLYNIVDQIIDTGVPVEVVRHGATIKISVDKPKSKFARLKKHPGTIKGDPESIVHLNWENEWRGHK